MNSLTHALRRLRHSPGFAIFAVVTLALSIGVTTAVYSLIRTGLRPDVDVPAAARLVLVTDDSLARTPRPARLSWLDYQDIAALSQFDGVVAWNSATVSVSTNGRAEFGVAEAVSGNYFDVIGLRAMKGRALDVSDDEPGAPRVMVISAAAWRTRLQSDPGVIGRSIKVAGHEFQIVGVVPEDFRGLEPPRGFQRPEVWLPLSSSSFVQQRYARQDRARRDHQWLSIAGRLAPASILEVAGQQLEHLSTTLDATEPLPPLRFVGGAATPQTRRWHVRAVNQPIDFTEQKSLFRMVLLLPTLVLLVACSNLANFALSRGIARRNELAVRQALGASRWQLVRGFVVEYGLISAAGAGGGLIVADRLLAVIAAAVERTAGSAPQFRIDARIDSAVLIAVGGLSLLSIVIAGLLPALQLTRGLRSAIDTDHSSTSMPRWRGRGNLIALQVSVSLALLLVSALCVRQLPKLKVAAASGMALDRIAVVTVPQFGQVPGNEGHLRTADEVVRRMAAVPGVESSSYARTRQYTEMAGIGVEGATLKKGVTQLSTRVVPVAPEYFRTVDIKINAGRPIGIADTTGSEPIAVLNASLARALFGSTAVVGRRIALGNEAGAAFRKEPPVLTVTVVGIASDTYERDGSPEEMAYVPITQRPSDVTELLARSRNDVEPGDLAVQMREILRRINPDIAVSFVGRADAADFGPRVMLKVFVIWFGSLAVLALGFAMSGLYGVLSHVVGLRTRELGLRAALGADQVRLIRLVLKDGARPVVEGIIIGFGIAAGARLGMQPWFEDPVTAVDPLALVIALAPLIGAALLACYLPARRASRVDPNVALKHL